MRYAANFPNGGPWSDPRTLGELAHLAEEAGWDGVFVEDYIVWQGHQDMPTYDPWIALAAIALCTKRVRLGTMVTALPRRRPWKVAREAVTLDHLSNGRVTLGVGIGDTSVFIRDSSLTHLGEATDSKVRAEMLDESLDILAGLWSGKPFSYDGKYYHIKEITFLPTPVQKPRIPIWIGGGWPLKGPVERAARWDGSCLYKHPVPRHPDYCTPEDIRALKAFVDARRPAGAPFDIAADGTGSHENEQEERALIRALAEAGATWCVQYIAPQTGGLDQVRSVVKRGPLRID